MNLLLNYTPHTVTLCTADGTRVFVYSSGRATIRTPPRVVQTYADVCRIPVMSAALPGPVEGLPEFHTLSDRYQLVIVSYPVGQAVALEYANLSAEYAVLADRSRDEGEHFRERVISDRLQLLRRVVTLGTGPDDGCNRFPVDHPQAGQVESVTRLLFAIGDR